MAYDKDKLYNDILAKIKLNPDVYFIEDIVSLLPCSKTTFYEFFPIDSDEMNNIKDSLDQNRVSTKLKLRKRLAEGDKAAEILALYKLIGTESERKALSQNYTDLTTKGQAINWIEEKTYE